MTLRAYGVELPSDLGFGVLVAADAAGAPEIINRRRLRSTGSLCSTGRPLPFRAPALVV
ncbi:MAG TPA: hypothetical protein VGN55_02345 [Xanthobacteraceae bacterium]|jgi:hypothetical protein